MIVEKKLEKIKSILLSVFDSKDRTQVDAMIELASNSKLLLKTIPKVDSIKINVSKSAVEHQMKRAERAWHGPLGGTKEK